MNTTDTNRVALMRRAANDPKLCPSCESSLLIGRHCKTLCLHCGYVESCEDNFVPNVESPPDDA